MVHKTACLVHSSKLQIPEPPSVVAWRPLRKETAPASVVPGNKEIKLILSAKIVLQTLIKAIIPSILALYVQKDRLLLPEQQVAHVTLNMNLNQTFLHCFAWLNATQ